MISDARLTAVDGLLQAWAAAWSVPFDVERLLALYTEDVVHEDVTVGMVHYGKDELRHFAQNLIAIQPDVRMDIQSGFWNERAGAAEWTMSATLRAGSLTRVLAVGKPYVTRGASIFGLRDGRIARQADYWDMVSTWHQVGIFPGERPAR